MSYLKDGVLPKDKEDARKLKVRVARFILIDEVLYKKGFSWETSMKEPVETIRGLGPLFIR